MAGRGGPVRCSTHTMAVPRPRSGLAPRGVRVVTIGARPAGFRTQIYLQYVSNRAYHRT